jgi:hypothetical protein
MNRNNRVSDDGAGTTPKCIRLDKGIKSRMYQVGVFLMNIP